jgi:hypothetical protein
MKTISRHPIDLDLAERQLVLTERVLQATLGPAREKAGLLNQLLSTARDKAFGLCVLRPDDAEICPALRLGAQAAAALFAASSSLVGEVEVPLGDGPPARLKCSGPSSISDVANWRSGFFLAAICRDLTSLNILCQTPLEVLRSSSTRGDEFLYLTVEAYQSLWKRDGSTGQRLQSALEATDPALPRIAPEDFLLNIIIPELQLLYGFLTQETASFNEALALALERHKKYWSKKDRKIDPSGYLAVGPLALTSFAFDAEMSTEAESDYLPRRLYEGGCAS